MEQIDGQVSIWDMLTEDEMPKPARSRIIAPQDFHIGTKGWQLHAVWFGDKVWPVSMRNCIVIYSDCWVSTAEPRNTEYGIRTQGERVRRKGETPGGWTGRMPKLFALPGPTWDDYIQHAHTDFIFDGCNWWKPGVRVIDADHIVTLEGDPLTEDEKALLRKWRNI